MKQFEITLVVRELDTAPVQIKSIDKIESNDMVQLLSQFNILIVTILRALHQKEIDELNAEKYNDDIPF